MRIAWSTDSGPDPALIRSFPAEQPSAVAVAGDLLVTLTEHHEDFDCPAPNLHDQRCPSAGLRVWDRASGRLLRTADVDPGAGTGNPMLVTAVVGGRTVAVAGRWLKPPVMLDLATGEPIGVLPGHEDATEVQAFALAGPDVVTVGWDGIVRVAGRAATFGTGERAGALAIVGPAGRPVAAVGGREAVTLWDLADGTPLGRLETDAHTLAAWPGSALLAVQDQDGGIVLWDTATGAHHRPATPPARRFGRLGAVTTPTGRRLLTLDGGSAVHLWDVDAGREFGAPLHGPVRAAHVTADGPGSLIAVSPEDDAVSLWRLGENRAPEQTRSPGDIRRIQVTADGWIVGDGGPVRWRLSDGARQAGDGGFPPDRRPVTFHGSLGGVRLAGGRTIEHPYPPRGAVAGVLGDRPAVAVNWMFGPFTVYDQDTLTEIPAEAAVEIGESPQAWAGDAVITVLDCRVRAHDLRTGVATLLQPGEIEPVTALAARGTDVAVARADGTVSIVDVPTARERARIGLPFAATALAWAPTGELVVAVQRDVYCVAA
ncbi:WD40 repeat domain-containing protein [Actinoplanes sp. NPDC049802]|uniref:WD40 repeat domain-containing protein n=1 Tax=Actinoplanes sp. NPDC049802 TaxID=3154742 RepID=UPI003411EED4